MKKLEDAVRRFGTPDHGRTAKRLRDFEAQLVRGVDLDEIAAEMRARPLIDGITLLDKPWPQDILVTGSDMFGVKSREQQFGSEAYDKSLQRHRSVIQSLQVLLNQKDEEIDMLRSAPPVRARDLWIAAGLVSLVLLSAYYGFM